MARESPPLPTSAEVLALNSREAVSREAEAVYAIALWIASELRTAPALSKEDFYAVTYADIAARANESTLLIQVGRFPDRYGDARRNALLSSGNVREQATERQAVITAFLLGKSKRAFEWLRVNGVCQADGKPRGVLSYYGQYLNKAVRNCEVLAALLAAGEAEEGSVTDILIGASGHESSD
jgi:hypothetical protein